MEELLSMIGSGIVILGFGAAITLLAGVMLATGLLYICPPNKVLIFAGRRHKLKDGRSRGFRVIFGGRGWRVPILEKVEWMSLNVQEIPISVRNAYSKGGIPMNIDAIANVKTSSDPILIGNAIERFLGRTGEIARVAKETLEGHLRGALATLTPEEVNEDRLKFADSLTKESQDDLRKLGLQLDTLKIQNVSDSVNYLDSIGRGAIAEVVRDAEVAESDAQREAAQVESESAGRASVTEANVDAAIVKMQNELRRIKADLESNVRSEEERTLAAAAEARALAEQELQKVRVQLQEIQLTADEVMPAEAKRQQREFRAKGKAASIREQGEAVGEALDMLHEAWASAGDAALAISLIEQLEDLLQTAADGVRKVQIDKLTMIDSGRGQVLSGYLSAYPAMIKTIFEAVGATTGIDIPQVIAGSRQPAKQKAVASRTAPTPPRRGARPRKGDAS